jgi:hypothetical protein
VTRWGLTSRAAFSRFVRPGFVNVRGLLYHLRPHRLVTQLIGQTIDLETAPPTMRTRPLNPPGPEVPYPRILSRKRKVAEL